MVGRAGRVQRHQSVAVWIGFPYDELAPLYAVSILGMSLPAYVFQFTNR